ncbi:MAG: hypothetical protein K8U03_23355 [Planctomycetia bacterium]|nr:hypothetical protein [Planctomycetia bacterium]
MSAAANGQLSGPPMQLPTHSAFREDAKPGVARLYDLPSVQGETTTTPKPLPRAPVIASPATPRLFAPTFNVALAPPSVDQRDYVPNPPYATSPLTSPEIPLMAPVETPLFSWRPSHIPEGAKTGIFQQSLFRTTYLPRIGADGFGMTSLTKQFTFALPPFISGSPILVSPSYTTHFLDGPAPIDVPPHLIDGEIEFRYMKQATPRLGIDISVAPSYYGDGHNKTSDAWRVTGRALGAWSWNERWQIVFGGVYTGRSDFPAVPVAGAIWKPASDIRIEAIFPRPRAYFRPFVNGTIEHWVYLGGEYGGNTWAIEQPGGISDKMTYADLRLLVGWERRAPRGFSGRFEAGWVFDRSIEFNSGSPGLDPSDTLMVRGEMSF